MKGKPGWGLTVFVVVVFALSTGMQADPLDSVVESLFTRLQRRLAISQDACRKGASKG